MKTPRIFVSGHDILRDERVTLAPTNAVSIDNDGTLCDTDGLLSEANNRLIREQLRLEPLTPAEKAGLDGPGYQKALKRKHPDHAQEIDAQWGPMEQMFHAQLHRLLDQGEVPTPIFEDARQFLGQLNGHIPFAMVTNGDERYAKGVWRTATGMDLAVVLGGRVLTPDQFAKKPHPDMLIAAKTVLNARRVLHIGDSIADADAAVGAGQPCVLLDRNRGAFREHFREVLLGMPNVLVVDTFNDLTVEVR